MLHNNNNNNNDFSQIVTLQSVNWTLWMVTISPNSLTLNFLVVCHELHDVLHEVPAFLSVRWRLGLLHEVRDLNSALSEGVHHDPQLPEDGQVLTVGEVDGMDVESRGGGALCRDPAGN